MDPSVTSISVTDLRLDVTLEPNATNATSSQADEGLVRLEIATLTVILVLIIGGNIPVLVTIIFGRLSKTRMYYFLLHLCIADLITGVFNVIPQLAWEITGHFYGGNVLCKTVKYLQILGPYLSSYILSATSVDRFQAICYPLSNNHLSLYRAKLSIASAWALSLLFCLPQAFIFSHQEIAEGVFECWGSFPSQPWGERIYVTWYAISVFFVPFVVLFYTHLRICCELWLTSRARTDIKSKRTDAPKAKKRKKVKPEESANSGDQFVPHPVTPSTVADQVRAQTNRSETDMIRAKIKSVKLTVTVICCYILCSSPFICVQLWAYWYPGAQESASWTGMVVTIVMLLSSLNSCVNPFIYLTFNGKLYSALMRLFFCRKEEDDGDNQQTCDSTSSK